ncbi:MAG: hypothetical protein CL920_27835 [Deltaproteobacteria bacterium]|nr:hypothetical protein [Deltaproteobacteria bacterium]
MITNIDTYHHKVFRPNGQTMNIQPYTILRRHSRIGKLFVLLIYALGVVASFGCGGDVARTCATDNDCVNAPPHIYCVNDACSSQQCTPGETKSCYEADPVTADFKPCRKGTQTCSTNGLWGKCKDQQLPRPELCDKIDNDCDGQVDESLDCQCIPTTKRACYSGPVNTLNTGPCRPGLQYCEGDSKWGNCLDQITPMPELCDKQDNDCNGQVDDNPECVCVPGITQECYAGPKDTAETAPCQSGLQICGPQAYWGSECLKQITPKTELCNNQDDDCDGQIDNGIHCGCTPGERRDCNTGQPSPCHQGFSFCSAQATWSPCFLKNIPQNETCGNQKDDDCDGLVDDGCQCTNGTIRECYTGPEGTAGVGVCKKGSQRCENEQWGPCQGEQTPEKTENCNKPQEDNNCNGERNEGCSCQDGETQVCGVDVGECRKGKKTCKNKEWGPCEGGIKADQNETCDGKDNDCDGQIDEDFPQKGLPCSEGVGECARTGTYDCAPGGQATVCNANPAPPMTELCNGKDDDCDGRVDEDFPTLGNTCTNGRGACQTSGKIICENVTQTICDAIPSKPQSEQCDKIDNDCDGLVDEGCTCTNGTVQDCYTGTIGCTTSGSGGAYTCTSPCKTGTQSCQANKWTECRGEQKPEIERCNGKDDNCDGQVDEPFSDKGDPCTVGLGECKVTGKMICNQTETSLRCDVTPGPKTTEICDGKDNDCDGQTDESWPQKGDTCSVGKGVCKASGVMTCDVDGKGISCGATAGQATTEVCDGKDNDCDGQTDEDFPTLGQSCTKGKGICQATGKIICTFDGTNTECDAQTPPPQAEVCDQKDNDCDGQIDEGCQCTDSNTRPCFSGSGCTPSGNSFTCEGICKAGTQTCQNGAWGLCTGMVKPTVESCNGKDDDCNGLIDDALYRSCSNACGSGYEQCQNGQYIGCTAPKPTTELCNGRDDDCDGQTDEGYLNLYTSCTKGQGACQNQGYYQCSADQKSVVCSAIAGSPSSEICNRIDDDCDGQVDNGLNCQCYTNQSSYRMCTTTLPGICRNGYQSCQSNGTWGVCQRSQQPQAETCNGQDDDCDGQIDEGVCYSEYPPDEGPQQPDESYSPDYPDEGPPNPPDEYYTPDYPDEGPQYPPDEYYSYDRYEPPSPPDGGITSDAGPSLDVKLPQPPLPKKRPQK